MKNAKNYALVPKSRLHIPALHISRRPQETEAEPRFRGSPLLVVLRLHVRSSDFRLVILLIAWKSRTNDSLTRFNQHSKPLEQFGTFGTSAQGIRKPRTFLHLQVSTFKNEGGKSQQRPPKLLKYTSSALSDPYRPQVSATVRSSDVSAYKYGQGLDSLNTELLPCHEARARSESMMDTTGKGYKAHSKSVPDGRKDRKSGTGTTGAPKKGGHGGKFTWAGDRFSAEEIGREWGVLDAKDPNYEDPSEDLDVA
ncbi:hypothetical protein H6P81_001000 [Aristolochia fimbriata]|uniref:Uncharacterized protein n=1 Tax=Aristolochia fimbriata TaxID=158543 RepID=A0AAV7F8Z5_ARIFI|nr:hypothetical protein H6P81_001000 [Aristolochia fimbriata]